MTVHNLKKNVTPTRWRGLFFIALATTFLYVFMEWLFLVTKPSFLTNLSWLAKVGILMFVAGFVISLSMLVIGVIYLLAQTRAAASHQRFTFYAAAILPTTILAALILILLDNFTYTLFGYGIINSVGIMRAAYAITFLVIFLVLFRKMRKWSLQWGKKILPARKGWQVAGIIFVFLLSILILPFTNTGSQMFSATLSNTNFNKDRLPNIILITADGLNAQNMSVYGYQRETTPFLNHWKDESLIVENAFTNSAKTGGSTISLLTGKYPATTRLVYPPDILHNVDSYQHLPGMLHTLGYYTAQYGHNYYVDAYTQNMLRAFDEVNGQKGFKSNYVDVLDDFIPGDYAYFMYETFNRIFDRMRHIFFILKMDDSFLELTQTEGFFDDNTKIQDLSALLQNHEQPFFVHLHWMGTHGEFFYVQKQVFSAGKDMQNQTPWDVDFYDDSILQFDQTLSKIFDGLEEAGQSENTIIVIASDHGQRWVANRRLPLIFHFPEGQYAQQIELNSQNLDIAPTLLAYLEIDQPVWMEGESLLNGLDVQRPIFSVDVGDTIMGENIIEIDEEAAKPPFYQFGELTMVDCDHFYSLSLRNPFKIQMSTIDGYYTPCKYVAASEGQAFQLMIEHLNHNQFDTSSLEEWAKR